MKATYYVIRNQKDSNVYSIRAKTRKEVLRIFVEDFDKDDYFIQGNSWGDNGKEFIEVEKVEINYKDAFDLVEQLVSEGCADFNVVKKYKYSINQL